ncbi:hypothetical protein LP419_19190 [Massilia sp. H-1]|nr:hypothetical protein LP419_19190 [Massilia sp. H-1]
MYGRAYEVADIHTTKTPVGGVQTSVADQLTFINYAFGNVYAKNGGYECDMVTKAEVGNDSPTSPEAEHRWRRLFRLPALILSTHRRRQSRAMGCQTVG